MTALVLDCSSDLELALQRATEVLRRGGLVAIPTETVYGLAGHALDPEAVRRIFVAKGRPSNNPLIVHIGTLEQARALTTNFPEMADRLAKAFWPGPLTLVLPSAAVIPPVVTAGGATVALRMPAHPVALRLLRESGLPLAAPSANRSTRLSPTRADHVVHDLADRIDLILDAGPTTGGIESTVLDLTHQPPRLLRPGLLSPAALEAIIGPIDRTAPVSTATALPSPGLLERHYAPRTPLECVCDSGHRVRELLATGQRVGWVPLDTTGERIPEVQTVVLPADPMAYAARLYAVLHELDRAGLDRIIVEQPPADEAWLAIRDRLRRAAEPRKLSS
jgi:L-threonylcarbamoyladenylate synthase